MKRKKHLNLQNTKQSYLKVTKPIMAVLFIIQVILKLIIYRLKGILRPAMAELFIILIMQSYQMPYLKVIKPNQQRQKTKAVLSTTMPQQRRKMMNRLGSQPINHRLILTKQTQVVLSITSAIQLQVKIVMMKLMTILIQSYRIVFSLKMKLKMAVLYIIQVTVMYLVQA